MLQWGLHITQSGDPLHKIGLEEMYRRIRQPKAAFQDRIRQLRAVRAMDEKQYRELKKGLPYFVCGLFHPAVRRRENFAEIRHFLLDLDHLSQTELPAEVLAQRMRALPEAEMCFTSPGGDGLKLMFRLSEGCRDAAMFSAFYKVFSRRFAEKHSLQQVVDYATSDVSRACFVSFDPEAFYNPEYSLAEKLQKLQEAGLNEPPAGQAEPLRPLAGRIRDMLNIVQSEPVKATDMTYLVMYDITSDKVRNQIGKYLERQGCIRIQKSVFIARSEARNFQEICDTLNEVNSYYDNEDSILLVPVNTSDVRSMKVIGKALQIGIITDKPNTLFF